MAFERLRLSELFRPGRIVGLRRTRLATRATILTERLWPLVLPLLTVISLFVSLSWLGVFRLLPDWPRLILVALFAIAAIAALWPLRAMRLPSSSDVDRRIETANALRHAPLRSQDDRLAGDADPFAAALWQEHRKRLSAQLTGLRGQLPHTRIPERDPWALRAIAPLLLVVAFAYSLGPGGGSLGDGFRAAAGPQSVPPRIDAWVTPPAYTGQAPLYLTAEANREQSMFTVPQGSNVAVRVMGGSGSEQLVFLDAHTAAETALQSETVTETTPRRGTTAAASQFSGVLDADGLLSLKRGAEGDDIASWSFNVTPDDPPVINLTDEPTQAANGTLQLNYEVSDDYGVASAQALFEPADAVENARPLYDAPEMRLTLPRRSGEDNAARTSRDLTDHPWAGTLVEMVLEAEDGAAQTGRSEPTRFTLPERPFRNPLALALIEQRQILALDANAKPRVVDLMDAITLRPEDTIPELTHYLGIMAARSRLDEARTDDQLRGVVDYLWEIAVTIEDGALSDAERRLRMAQEALQEALEDGASDEEIAELMAELREAMQEFLREFAERAMQNPQSAMPMPDDMQQLSQSDLERMMDQIENLARSGARDEAQELLSQLQDMMNNLQAGNQQQQQGGGEQSEMNQQLNQLGELMRRQQELMNETFRMQQGEQVEPGQGGQMSPEDFADAMRQLQEGQGQIQQDLQAMMEALEGMGLEPGEGFGESGEAMGRAGDALGEGQGERAVGEQGQALEALRRGAQDMMQQMQQAMEGEGGGQQPGGRSRQGADRDPLGRPRATTGPDFGDTVRVPDEIDVQRARQILESIRERLGNALSPELERDYLERLLEMR
ncbi:TIGR02302 family protein [Aliihoeflea aestuarii]|uniref:TIGR02302 family protein n=1 Tax=Aliihoeflea aestuarii TaxID=453840 RepID=UPI00209536A2|nr:TIGR02302 family protein [Aliihoeflea aestuarii]MCO6392637.1 TIGR02302 family protein [Aliihoeflea aestuarii]